MIGRIVPLAIVALATAAAPARAAEDQTPILRCLVAATSLGQNPDKGIAQVGIMNSLFWLGRIDPAISEDELDRRISAIASTFTADDMRTELPRCGAEMKARGDVMQRIGRRMQQRGAPPKPR